jgi:competence protein ComFC
MKTDTPRRFMETADMLVPVPLSPARRRERTFNQAEEIAQELGKIFAKPVVRALRRVRETRPQAELKEKNRFPNVAGAFNLAPGETVQNKDIVLVDDVITTTATVRAAAAALAQAGARRIRVLALAKG